MSDFDALLAELEAIDGDPRTKRRVRQVLARFTGQEIYFSHSALVQRERRQLISRLASQSYPRDELARILSARWGVSLRTAQRWVARIDA